jgi:hypothetical protein
MRPDGSGVRLKSRLARYCLSAMTMPGYILRFFFLLLPDFLAGTLPPARRAPERPIAIACLRLVTRFPDDPLFSVPCFISWMAFSTLVAAFLPYRAIYRS